MTKLLRTAAVLLAIVLTAAGCSIRTAGSPKGDLELTAVFDDVSNLVVGHSVQLADVTVGTVTSIELVDNERARITMSIQDDVDLAVGTSAALSQTSLLGEQYVELRPPPANAPVVGDAEGQMLASGDEIGRTVITADFESVTERAIEFLGAVAAEDVATLTSTGANAIGGRGEDLNQLLRSLTTVVTDLDSQRLDIARTIDGFAQLGDDLARGDAQVVNLVDDLSQASVTLAENRHRIIGALRGVRDMTLVTNQAVLDDHTDSLISTIQDLDPILSTLAGQRPLIEDMLTGVNSFLTAIADNLIADASTPGQAQYVWTRGIVTPSGIVGDAPPPGPPSGGAPAVPLPDPTSVGATAFRTLNTLLGLLGDPSIRLPAALCRRLQAMDLGLDLRRVCSPAPGGNGDPLPVPLPDPAGVVDDVLGGVAG